jgi:uncharacterized protein with HEPN domain
MIDERVRLLLEDMIENARFAEQCISGLDIDTFAGVRTMVYAATRAVEVVGEAASQVPPEVRRTLPSIPWRQAIGMRNRLIHGYRSLEPETLYKTIRDNFPPLIAEIERILIDGA